MPNHVIVRCDRNLLKFWTGITGDYWELLDITGDYSTIARTASRGITIKRRKTKNLQKKVPNQVN